MNRRELLKRIGVLPAAIWTGSLYAAPAASCKLLFVFLRGGYDAANVLVPISSRFYYEVRPNIAIQPPGAGQNSAIGLNADWGLHPALRDTIYPLFVENQVTFIPFAGTGNTSRSHFETQDSIELGTEGRNRNFQSGFLNRLVATMHGGGAISFTQQLPLVLQGKIQVPNIALRSIGKSALDERQASIIASMYAGTALAQQVSNGFSVREEVMHEMAGEMEAANRNAISSKGFEYEARRIAKLMKDRYDIGFVDVGGWDTHVGEGGGTGYLAGRLDELGRGLSAFAEEMGTGWRNTVVVVVSEFGRTIRENGNRGTDHGHGTVFWLLGGGIRGSRIAGEQTRVEQASLFQNRDYPVLNEYRAVLGGLFARMYGLNAAALDEIFPGSRPRDLDLL